MLIKVYNINEHLTVCDKNPFVMNNSNVENRNFVRSGDIDNQSIFIWENWMSRVPVLKNADFSTY